MYYFQNIKKINMLLLILFFLNICFLSNATILSDINRNGRLGLEDVIMMMQKLSDNPNNMVFFSEEYLSGKIFYDVFYEEDINQWEGETLKFENGKIIVSDKLVENPQGQSQNYTIINENTLTFYDIEDNSHNYIKLLGFEKDYLLICFAESIEELNNCNNNEYLFFEINKALAFIAENGAQFAGASILEIITTAQSPSNFHFGISCNDNYLYSTLYASNSIVKISLLTNDIVDNYPKLIEFVNLPHGLTIDNSDSSIWICDLNNSMVRHYSNNMQHINSIDVGSQPVNALYHDNKIFIADRQTDSLYILNKANYQIDYSFKINGMKASHAFGFIDLFIYMDNLYIVSDEINGIFKSNLMGGDQEIINISSQEDFNANGIFIKDNRIYLNSFNSIIVTDMEGNILNKWQIQGPEEFSGMYVDIHIQNDKIYIPSYNQTPGFNGPAHISVYKENFVDIQSD